MLRFVVAQEPGRHRLSKLDIVSCIVLVFVLLFLHIHFFLNIKCIEQCIEQCIEYLVVGILLSAVELYNHIREGLPTAVVK